MKKFLLIAVMVVSTLSFTQLNAQTYQVRTTVAGDTIVTSGSLDTTYKIIPVSAGYATASFKIAYTKISGTVDLKAYLYGGDGTNFETSASDSTAAFSNASGVAWINKTAPPFSHYKVVIRTDDGANTTQSVKIVWSYLLKRHD